MARTLEAFKTEAVAGFVESSTRERRAHALETHVTAAKAEVLDMMALAAALASEMGTNEQATQQLIFQVWKLNASSIIMDIKFTFEDKIGCALPSGASGAFRQAVMANVETLRAGRLP